jgi:pyruvate dehydrogenase E1 component alpha subunit
MNAPPEEEAVTARHRLDLLRTMTLIRRFEETCAELYSAGRIRGFLHLYVGEEAVATGVLSTLGPEDTVVTTYREHGHALARGVPTEALLAEMFGRVTGCSRGRGGSMHLFDRETNFLGGNAVVAGAIPLAVGVALAEKMRGRSTVTACFFGEGALAEGAFHESANLAALWRLPVLFCCENNRYAMGTRLTKEHAQTDLALRASCYGIRSTSVDGMDVLAVQEAAARAVDEIRAGVGPHFLELRTYRYRAHSMYDADRYRDKAEIAHWKERDPIEALATDLTESGDLDDAGRAQLESEVAAELEEAVERAEQAPVEPVGDLLRHVRTEGAP